MTPKILQQQHAKDLFLNTALSRTQIAETLGVNRKTLYKWIKEGDWLQQKFINHHGPTRLATQYYEQLGAINDIIAARAQQPYPTKEECLVIRQLTNTIKNFSKRQPVAESVKAFMTVSGDLIRRDSTLAREVTPFIDKYVNQLVRSARLGEDINYLRHETEFEDEYRSVMAYPDPADPTEENGVTATQQQESSKPAPTASHSPSQETIATPQNEKNEDHLPPLRALTPREQHIADFRRRCGEKVDLREFIREFDETDDKLG